MMLFIPSEINSYICFQNKIFRMKDEKSGLKWLRAKHKNKCVPMSPSLS